MIFEVSTVKICWVGVLGSAIVDPIEIKALLKKIIERQKDAKC